MCYEAVSTIKVVAITDSVSAGNAAVAQISLVLISVWRTWWDLTSEWNSLKK